MQFQTRGRNHHSDWLKMTTQFQTYWSYEVCHGKYIRQYHDEKIKGGTKTTEYYLGYYKGPLPMPIDEEKVPSNIVRFILYVFSYLNHVMKLRKK